MKIKRDVCIVPAGAAPFPLTHLTPEAILDWAWRCKDHYDSHNPLYHIRTDGLAWWAGNDPLVVAVLIDEFGPRIPITEPQEQAHDG